MQDIIDVGSITGSGKIPWKRAGPLTQVFLPGKSQGNNSSYIKCGNPLYKFEINTMLFIYSKHKESTENLSVLVSLYPQIGDDFFFED